MASSIASVLYFEVGPMCDCSAYVNQRPQCPTEEQGNRPMFWPCAQTEMIAADKSPAPAPRHPKHKTHLSSLAGNSTGADTFSYPLRAHAERLFYSRPERDYCTITDTLALYSPVKGVSEILNSH